MDERSTQQTQLRLGTVALLGVVCLYVVITSISLGVWTDLGPGPGFFPLCASIIIILSLGGWIWNYFTPTREGREDHTILGLDPDVIEAHTADGVDDNKAEEAVEEGIIPARLRLPTVVLSLALLIALLPPLGFQLSMFLFLLFQMRIVGGTRWLVSLILAAAGSFGVFVLFTGVLSVTLPTAGIGLLGRMGF